MVKEHYRCSLGTKKVTKWGNSKGILLPSLVLENLNLSEGDAVRRGNVTSKEGSSRLSYYISLEVYFYV